MTGKLKENNMDSRSVIIPLEVFKEFLDTIRINFGPLAKKNKDARIAILNVKEKAEYISAQIGCDFQDFGSWPAEEEEKEQKDEEKEEVKEDRGRGSERGRGKGRGRGSERGKRKRKRKRK